MARIGVWANKRLKNNPDIASLQRWAEIMNWVSINPTRGPDGPLPCAELFYLSVNPLEMQCLMLSSNGAFLFCKQPQRDALWRQIKICQRRDLLLSQNIKGHISYMRFNIKQPLCNYPQTTLPALIVTVPSAKEWDLYIYIQWFRH